MIDEIHDDVDAGLVDATPFVRSRISRARARSASRNWHRFFTRVHVARVYDEKAVKSAGNSRKKVEAEISRH
nr:DUF3606 domain-containing protein [Rhizobium laguerreae]